MAIVDLYEEFEKGARNLDEVIIESATLKQDIIFLSHKSEDKFRVRSLAKKLEERGYTIYLDENDKFLQKAHNNGNLQRVVTAIKKAIIKSSKILCILSKKTQESWWVPFEIGIAQSENKDVETLLLEHIRENELPEFLRIFTIHENEDAFIQTLKKKYRFF